MISVLSPGGKQGSFIASETQQGSRGQRLSCSISLIPVWSFPVLSTAISIVLKFAVGWHFAGLPGGSGLGAARD